MKFGVIIGNPPYQEDVSKENGGGRQTKPIYDKFIEAAINLSSDNGYVAMITNNTFLTNDAKSDIRNKMIDAGLRVLVNYPISGEVFNGIGVSACHFLIDKNNKEHKFKYNKIEHSEIVNTYESVLKTDDLILESKYEFEIPNKVKDTKSMGDISLGVKTFGIGVNGRIGFDGKGAFVNILKSKLDNCITIKNKISVNGIGYIYISELPKGHEYVHLYKVICPYKISKSSQAAFNKVEILKPQSVCTEGWAVISVFNNEVEAINCSKYVQSKLFKFLCYVFCSNGMTAVTRILLNHVPLQDFTSSSDIDWSKSIQDIDQQLYKKYNLSEEEIVYIEQTIKPMV